MSQPELPTQSNFLPSKTADRRDEGMVLWLKVPAALTEDWSSVLSPGWTAYNHLVPPLVLEHTHTHMGRHTYAHDLKQNKALFLGIKSNLGRA